MPIGDKRQAFRRRLLAGAVLLSIVLVAGSTGYYALGGGRWSMGETLYFTVVTLSTVGFGETLPGMADVPYARMLTVGLIIFGSGTLLYFISTLTAFIVEGDIGGAIRRNRMQKRIDKLQGHFIVCGAGSTGVHVIEELINTRHAFVVVDRDEERLTALAERHGTQGSFLFVHGDATQDEVLLAAGIDRAAGVIASLTDDKENVFVTLTAAQLAGDRARNGALRIVAKSIETTSRAKLLAAGAHRVVSPTEIGGMRMVSEMIRPSVVEFLDLMLRDPDKNLRIEEVEIPRGSPLQGVTLGRSAIRSAAKVLVIAVKHPETPVRYSYNPGPDLSLEIGMTLIVLAETQEISILQEGITSGTIGRFISR